MPSVWPQDRRGHDAQVDHVHPRTAQEGQGIGGQGTFYVFDAPACWKHARQPHTCSLSPSLQADKDKEKDKKKKGGAEEEGDKKKDGKDVGIIKKDGDDDKDKEKKKKSKKSSDDLEKDGTGGAAEDEEDVDDAKAAGTSFVHLGEGCEGWVWADEGRRRNNNDEATIYHSRRVCSGN